MFPISESSPAVRYIRGGKENMSLRWKKPSPISHRKPTPATLPVLVSPAISVVLPNEDKAQFIALLDAYNREFRPEGVVETGLVEQMAVAKWREQRCWRYEVPVIERGRTDAEVAREEQRAIRIWSSAYRMLRQLQKGRLSRVAEDRPDPQPAGPTVRLKHEDGRRPSADRPMLTDDSVEQGRVPAPEPNAPGYQLMASSTSVRTGIPLAPFAANGFPSS